MRGVVQVVKKNGGENNLHYHTGIASFWMVLKGRVRFYGPDDVVIGEFGPMEGTITPRFSRYWFENIGEDDLEILQVAAFGSDKLEKSGRTDVSAHRFDPNSAQHFEAKTAPAKGLRVGAAARRTARRRPPDGVVRRGVRAGARSTKARPSAS